MVRAFATIPGIRGSGHLPVEGRLQAAIRRSLKLTKTTDKKGKNET